jgi:Predicted transcriptional regulators
MTEPTYKSISEVSKILNLYNKKNGKLNTHTIRFWEKEFTEIKPKIFAGKRRYYNKECIKILKLIKFLLKEKGFTIKGVKKYLKNENSFDLDVSNNNSINSKNINLKSKIQKISNLIKDIKKIN